MPLPVYVVHLLSGGLDSTVLLYDLLDQKCCVHALLVDYGQKHRIELRKASAVCERLVVKRSQVEVPPLMGSRLTDGRKASFVVPNRNAVLLSIAVSLASSIGAESVTYACNLDDAEEFPDCRSGFVDAMNAASRAAETKVEICAPYIRMTKREIVERGRELKVPFEDTYSCYMGQMDPCRECPACLKREAALK